jgi:PilZ domain
MPPQTRLDERLPIFGLLAGDITVVEPLTVKELGVGGATIETRFPLVIDSLHELRLLLGGQSVVMKGRVAHSHVSQVDSDAVAYHSGVEFVALPEHVHNAIAAYLESLRTPRSSPD